MTLPEEYVAQKFFEFGHSAKYNTYNRTYQCGCPICHEGKSFGKKQRCYYVPNNDNVFCHNCGWSSKPFNWILEASGMTTLDIIREIREFDPTILEYDVKDISQPINNSVEVLKSPPLPDDCINLYDETQTSYYSNDKIVQMALKLIHDRKLDIATNRPQALYVSLTDRIHKNRLIIPFNDENGKVVFYQSRSFTEADLENRPKYISKVGGDRGVFNLDKVSSEGEHVFIFEGPIDAFFLKNSVAIAGITTNGDNLLTKYQEHKFNTVLRFKKKVWCLDSQWIDEASMSASKLLLGRGESVFIWPKELGKKFKDLNDVICSSSLDGISESFILKNTFKGLEGVLKLKFIN